VAAVGKTPAKRLAGLAAGQRVPEEQMKQLIFIGALSMYAPNDGHNRGTLACTGAPYTHDQVHIALRQWRNLCGRLALVCTRRRCAVARVMDSGPWGATCGNTYRVVPGALPEGCRWRGVADLSYGLWRKLGQPRGRSKLWVFVPTMRRRASLVVPGES
jgi:hypothetical protein